MAHEKAPNPAALLQSQMTQKDEQILRLKQSLAAETERAERAERELTAAKDAMGKAGVPIGDGISLVFGIHLLDSTARSNGQASDEWKASCETAQYETAIVRQSRVRLVWLTREFREMIETAIKQMNLANTVIRGASGEIDELKDARDQAERDNRTLRDELRAARPDEASYERLRWMIQHVANVEIIKRWGAEKGRAYWKDYCKFFWASRKVIRQDKWILERDAATMAKLIASSAWASFHADDSETWALVNKYLNGAPIITVETGIS